MIFGEEVPAVNNGVKCLLEATCLTGVTGTTFGTFLLGAFKLMVANAAETGSDGKTDVGSKS